MVTMQNYRYSTVVPDTSNERVLRLQSPDGWTLPYFERDRWAIWHRVDGVNEKMSDLLDVNLTTLRCLGIVQSSPTDMGEPVYAMEVHDREWRVPADGSWFSRHEFAKLTLAVEEHRPIVLSWFRDLARKPAQTSLPLWYLPGWYDRAVEWISGEIERMGARQSGPVVQLRSSQRSAVLRAETGAGPVYFKAVPAMFRHELALTTALAEKFQPMVPRVLAADGGENWLLLQGCGERDLAAYEEVGTWQEALREYADIQVKLSSDTDRLFSMGCPDRRLIRLANGIDDMLADTSAMLPDT